MTEADLVDRLERWRNARDRAALGELLKLHRDRAYAVAYRVLHEGAAAEDAVQEACLKLMSRTSGFESLAAFRVALYRAALQCSLNALRGQRRAERRRLELRHAGGAARTGEDPMPAPPDEETRERLRAAVDELPDELRLPVVLCYLEGLRLHEAAETLELPRQTLHDRLHRALERLRADLNRAGVTLAVSGIAAALAADAPPAASAALAVRLDAALPGAPCRDLPPVPREHLPFDALRPAAAKLSAPMLAACVLLAAAALPLAFYAPAAHQTQSVRAPAPEPAPVLDSQQPLTSAPSGVVPDRAPTSAPPLERSIAMPSGPRLPALALAVAVFAVQASHAADAPNPAPAPDAAPAKSVEAVLAQIRAHRAQTEPRDDLRKVLESTLGAIQTVDFIKSDPSSEAPVRAFQIQLDPNGSLPFLPETAAQWVGGSAVVTSTEAVRVEVSSGVQTGVTSAPVPDPNRAPEAAANPAPAPQTNPVTQGSAPRR